MRTKINRPKEWTKPQIRHLGRIVDIAGAQGVGAQAAGVKT